MLTTDFYFIFFFCCFCSIRTAGASRDRHAGGPCDLCCPMHPSNHIPHLPSSLYNYYPHALTFPSWPSSVPATKTVASGKKTVATQMPEKTPSVEPEVSQLLKDYASLLTNKQLSDVTITVGQRKFYAQRAILSVRSAVFAAMFQSGMQESKPNSTISVEDIEPDVFEKVLRFIYTDQVKGLPAMAHELLAAADKYALDKLKNMCEKHLCGHITKETVLQTLVQADLYRVQQLKDAAIRFICGNIKQMHAAGWKSFCEANPGLAAEIFSKM